MTGTHFGRSLINAVSCVVPDTLMYMVSYISRCYIRSPSRTRIINTLPPLLLVFSHTCKFPLAHTIIALLNCHFIRIASLVFISCDQKYRITYRSSSSVHELTEQPLLLLKIQRNPIIFKCAKFRFVYVGHLSQCYQRHV